METDEKPGKINTRMSLPAAGEKALPALSLFRHKHEGDEVGNFEPNVEAEMVNKMRAISTAGKMTMVTIPSGAQHMITLCLEI